ncbi:MAG: hypothetical protein ACRC7O_08450, partial [Fimbriiglobus sp.]
GSTLGTRGSEDGTVRRDEEHCCGARITLEAAPANAPFAITCGVYSSMFHTVYAGCENEAETKYDGMKVWLDRLVRIDLPTDEYHALLQEFVETFR